MRPTAARWASCRIVGNVIALAALVASCAGAPGTPSVSRAGTPPKQLRERQIIVALPLVAPALRRDMARRLARHHDIELAGAFPLASVGIHCVVFEVPAERSIADVVAALASEPGVELVQRNQGFEGLAEIGPGEAAEPSPGSDPYAGLQHGAAAIRADFAHRWSKGRGVRVAVVDTGVDVDHPDLEARIRVARNFVERGERTFSADLHGTAVAGVIAARDGNGVGIYGVAPEAELMAAKACWQAEPDHERARCSSWTIARAIDWALDSRADVLNLSLAGPSDPLLARLVEAALRRGVVVVAAADSGKPSFPASIPGVLAVLGSEEAREAPAAIGVEQLVAAPGDEVVTTAPGARYRFVSGSSLSTAHVSGAVALLLERAPGLRPDEVVALLRQTSRSGHGGASRPGIVDACAAIRVATAGAECARPMPQNAKLSWSQARKTSLRAPPLRASK